MRDRIRRTRVRLTLVYLGAFAAVVGVGATGLWFALASFEYGTVDASLDAQAQVVLSGLADSNLDLGGGEQLPGETQAAMAVAALLVAPDGRILDRSGQVSDPNGLAAIVRQSGAVSTQRVATRVVAGPALRRPLRRRTSQGAVLLLARPVGEALETLARVAILLVAVAAGLVIGAGSLGYWLAGRALRPVRMMSAT